jgi:SAM-dependent methyltransferase
MPVNRLSPEEHDRRLAEELEEWTHDQYEGEPAQRRDVHRARWGAFFETLGMTPGELPLPAGRAFSACVVGCNHGGFEWDVLESWPELRVDACDLIEPEVEPELWAHTRKRFGDRIRYYPATDVQIGLPDPPYDVIVVMSVLHHCPDPTAAARVLHQSLVPGGLLLVAEYVGEPGLGASDQRYRVADFLWQALPKEYKRREDGTIQSHPYRPQPETTRGFESIASDRLLPVMRSMFEVVHERLKNALLGYRMVVWGQGPLREADPNVDRLLWAFEKVLMTEGWLEGEDWYALLRKEVVPETEAPRRVRRSLVLALASLLTLPPILELGTDTWMPFAEAARDASQLLAFFS